MRIQLASVLLPVLMLATSCRKDKDTPEDFSGVYIAGMQKDSVTGIDRACYWKNGNITFNALPEGNANYFANAIAVNGGDVYTTGYANLPSSWRCQVWKNGQRLYSLGDGYSEGKAIAVAGTDIYVGGMLYEAPSTWIASYWKNQNPFTSLGISGNSARVTGMTVSGSNIYAVGNIGSSGKLWKNGTEVGLPNATGADLVAVTSSGTDVYVTGNVGVRTIRYWKNSNHTDITVPVGLQIFVFGIAVEGNDVYVCGREINNSVNIAKYWKNGNEVVLGDGIKNSVAHAIAVKNGKVYVAGSSTKTPNSFIDYATVWENGVANVIGGRISRPTAIVVK